MILRRLVRITAPLVFAAALTALAPRAETPVPAEGGAPSTAIPAAAPPSAATDPMAASSSAASPSTDPPSPQGDPSSRPERWPADRADRPTLERLLRESDVETSSGASSLPLLVAYLFDRLIDWIVRLLTPLANVFPGLDVLVLSGIRILGFLVLALVFCAVAIRILRSRSSRKAPPAGVVSTPLAETEAGRSPEAWARSMEMRLAAGDVDGALEALWWWLATALRAERVDPSWTTRELIARARRDDLLALSRSFDRMAYGPGLPAADDVRGLFSQLSAVLR